MTNSKSGFSRIDAILKRAAALGHAQSMLGVDEAVMMPTGGGEKRAEAMATLAEMAHETVTAPAVFDWIVEARGEDLDAMQSCALNEFEREYRNLTCLSGGFINRQVRTRMRSEQLWRELRPAGDWQAYLPALEDGDCRNFCA